MFLPKLPDNVIRKLTPKLAGDDNVDVRRAVAGAVPQLPDDVGVDTFFTLEKDLDAVTIDYLKKGLDSNSDFCGRVDEARKQALSVVSSVLRIELNSQ